MTDTLVIIMDVTTTYSDYWRALMKKVAAMMFILSSLTCGAAMASDNYIPWTFDDFDSDCNVIDNN
jgi:hypothetical protein